MASLTQDARKKANLRVLQRSDAAVLDICGTASHVVLYQFDQASWTKSNVEGSLFLVKRSEAPRFQLVVLNRASVDNWVLPLSGTFQMQDNAPYLIFRLKTEETQVIRGIWFHDEQERSSMHALLERVVKSLEQVADLEEKHKPLQVEQEAPPLLSPLSLNDDASKEESTQPQQPLVLDKKSLQLSLLSLIQDDRFLDLIHAQYLKVAHARAKRGKTPPKSHTP